MCLNICQSMNDKLVIFCTAHFKSRRVGQFISSYPKFTLFHAESIKNSNFLWRAFPGINIAGNRL